MSQEQRESKHSPLMKVYDQLVDSASKTVQFVQDTAEHAAEQVHDLFQSTGEHIAEKTGEARKILQVRMAMHDMEEHLSRLYPQIGKMLCDLSERQLPAPLLDKDLRNKLDLATEYRVRMAELRREVDTAQAAAKAQAAGPVPKPQH